MKPSLKEIKAVAEKVDQALPSGLVTPQHTAEGHFYQIGGSSLDDMKTPTANPTYPSVTGKLAMVKDPSIQNFAVNEAMRYVEAHIHECVVDGKINILKTIELLHEAKKAPKGVLIDAGDIGSAIHDRREEYFQGWINDDWKKRPDIRDYIKADDDPRLKAGMLGLNKFCDETGYVPIRTELMVYSHRWKVAGMLDDLGMIGKDVVLMDLKTSNRFKDSYFIQVALYYMMFEQLTGIQPNRAFILKVDKFKPAYKIEEIKNMRRMIAVAKNILRVDEGLSVINKQRKKLGVVKI